MMLIDPYGYMRLNGKKNSTGTVRICLSYPFDNAALKTATIGGRANFLSYEVWYLH